MSRKNLVTVELLFAQKKMTRNLSRLRDGLSILVYKNIQRTQLLLIHFNGFITSLCSQCLANILAQLTNFWVKYFIVNTSGIR